VKHEVSAISLSAASAAAAPSVQPSPHRGKGAIAPLRNNSHPDFIAGPENRLAATAVDWLLQPNEHSYSPLVLHGPSGTGKSHLAHELAQARPDAVFTNGADFARELAEAIDRDTVPRWRAKYRSAELLVFEDLTQIADRRAAQQELLHTLDELETRQVPVLVTSRLAPSQIAQLPPALRSRLTAGLEVPLTPPGVAARTVVLERLAAARGIILPTAAAKLLAEGLCVTVAELRGALLELEMHAAVPNHKRQPAAAKNLVIGADHVRHYLSARRDRLRPSLSQVTALAAKYFGLKPSQLTGPSRRRQVALSRSVAIYLGRQLTGKSLQALGKHFGNRDHTTILHSYRSIETRITDDSELRRTVTNIRELLAAGRSRKTAHD
jgi:chromosomal replication initiator protein